MKKKKTKINMKPILFFILIFGSGMACAMEQDEAVKVGKDILDCWLERDKSCDRGLVKLESRIAKMKGKRIELWKLIRFVLDTESAFRDFDRRKSVGPRVLEELRFLDARFLSGNTSNLEFDLEVADLIDRIKRRGRRRWAQKLAMSLWIDEQCPYARGKDRDVLLRALLDGFSGSSGDVLDILCVARVVDLDKFHTSRGRDFYQWTVKEGAGLLDPKLLAVLTQPLNYALDFGLNYAPVHDYFKRKKREQFERNNTLIDVDDLLAQEHQEKLFQPFDTLPAEALRASGGGGPCSY